MYITAFVFSCGLGFSRPYLSQGIQEDVMFIDTWSHCLCNSYCYIVNNFIDSSKKLNPNQKNTPAIKRLGKGCGEKGSFEACARMLTTLKISPRLQNIDFISTSYQLTGQKSNPAFIADKTLL